MPVSRTSLARIRRLLNPEYEQEINDAVNARQYWKKMRDVFDAGSKLSSGLASMVAFGASSVGDSTLSTWLSFAAGSLGTLSLTLLVFAGYSGKTSRDRTKELNTLLKAVGVTPMPQVVTTGDAATTPDLEVGTVRSM